MGAIIPVSAINIMVIRGLNIILLMSTGVIAAEVCMFAPVSVLFRQSNSTLRWVNRAITKIGFLFLNLIYTWEYEFDPQPPSLPVGTMSQV